MRFRDWIHPPRHVLAVFVAVACLSAGVLVWLAWLLLEQDKTVEIQRRQERVEQAADRATAVMQLSLTDLQSQLHLHPARAEAPPRGISIVSAGRSGITVRPEGGLLYYPVAALNSEAPPQAFAEGERLEFARRDLRGAARFYSRAAADGNAALRAGALTRLARVRRKVHEPEAALQAYTQLAEVRRVSVHGIPAGLISREGRASVLEEVHRTSELREEATALQNDLRSGRWQLVKSEYQFYSAQSRAWLGTAPVDDPDAVMRAEGLLWLWHNRASGDAVSSRLIRVASGAALVIWNMSRDHLDAAIAGPLYLEGLCRQAIPDADLRWTLSDLEGHSILGQPPPARQVVVRSAASAKLPWTLHVFAPPEIGLGSPSPRQRLLISVFAVLAIVLFTGAYFTLRAISSELHVARLQSDFVAAVSHEFRSPLTSLRQISEMLSRDRIPSEDLRRKSYEVLERETERLHRLVEGLLDFGRFEAGAATYRFEVIEIGAFIRAIITGFQESVGPNGFKVELYALTGETYVRADREALSRALWNLLDNAVKYSPTCRTVWVEVERVHNRISIAVRDCGLGIPMHEQREIFNRFVRGADSKALHIKGTGIGLAMVRHIVRAHGGEILLASEPGQGSRFTVVLHAAGGLR